MKIGIMTWFSYFNYGTFLQAVAIKRFLELNGHETVLINYIPDEKYIRPKEHYLIDILKRIQIKFEILFGGNFPYINVISGEKFILAKRKYLKLTKLCKTALDLEHIETDFDVVLCGSDQIWSPNCFDSHYFLDYVVDFNKMIAYAPSFGTSKIYDSEIAEKIGNLINRFKYLSVREIAGAKIIKELTGKEAPVVVDPTLLLDRNEWIKYLSISLKERKTYILAFFLGRNDKNWKTVNKISKRLNLQIKIIPVSKKDTKRKDVISDGVSPQEFIELIANAAYICTDSYHAILFSLIFRKQFICFKRFKENNQGNQNSRIYSILEITGLLNHIYDEQQDIICMDEIQYEKVDEKIEHYRIQSILFLENAIKEISKNQKETSYEKSSIN